MKILFVIHYPPPMHGSSAIGGYIKESTIINASFNCKYVNLGTSLTVQEIGKNSLKKMLKYFTLLFQVTKQLLIFRPDICYLTPTSKGVGLFKDLIVIAIVKILRIKRIYHFHTKGISNYQNRFFYNLIYTFMFKNSDVILLSSYLYPDIQKYVPLGQAYFCPNGIPQISDNNRFFNPNRKPELLFLSNLIESKGIHELISACKILEDRKIDFHCTIAGANGTMTEKELEAEILSKGLQSQIILLPAVFGDEKMRILQKSDIFVFPSYYHNECMPLVLIEAMQNSLPVITTHEGAIPDMVEDGVSGLLVPKKDPISLANALEKVINDINIRREMGNNGHKKYLEYFTLEKFESRLTEILHEIGKN